MNHEVTASARVRGAHAVAERVAIIDRNPQTWVPNIFEAKESDFKPQTHRIWRTPTQASRVEIQTVAP